MTTFLNDNQRQWISTTLIKNIIFVSNLIFFKTLFLYLSLLCAWKTLILKQLNSIKVCNSYSFFPYFFRESHSLAKYPIHDWIEWSRRVEPVIESGVVVFLWKRKTLLNGSKLLNIKKLTVPKDLINKWLLFKLEYAFLLKQMETRQNQSQQCQC